MKHLILSAVLIASAASAAPVESLRSAAADGFQAAPLALRSLAAPESQEPVVQPLLKVTPLTEDVLGDVLTRVNLAQQLDRNLHMTNYKLGTRALDLGIASEPGFKNFYAGFTDRSGTVLGALGDLERLRGDGVDIRIDAATSYNFRVQVNIFNPIRGSTLLMTPLRGTAGAQQQAKTGTLLDAARAHSTLMNLNGEEYWILYGHDAAPGGNGLAATRSFLFIHLDGLSTKTWPLSESDLKPGVPYKVDLGDNSIAVTLSDGELVIRAAN